MSQPAESWQQKYCRIFYESKPGWINGTEEFHRLCDATIGCSGKILEIGAGPSNPTSRFLATIGELHGLDPDPQVRENDALSTAAVLEDARFPFPDASFDACVSNYVIEHVADPAAHLREVARVLRPRGAYVFRTPNQFHYVALVSRATPHWFHVLVANRLRNQQAQAHDPYPTVYRCNSRRSVRELSNASGFEVSELRMIEKEPSYGMASPLLFFPLWAYERLVNATPAAAGLRANILAVLRKR
jgi:SAM-dependent methyltransferase